MREKVQKLQQYYNPERVKRVDADFLSFEEEMAVEEDLDMLQDCIDKTIKFETNPHNSVLLYVLDITNDFDFEKARSNTVGGSPPDIDLDFEALGRAKIIDWVVEHWGREHVANIITRGTFKPKSLTRRYFKITEEPSQHMYAILDKIPKDHFGKAPTLTETIKGTRHLKNDDKNYPPNPDLETKPEYAGWHKFATSLEGMVANYGIHAGGIVISSDPIPETIPCWKNSKSEFITQYDMHEVEELGSIKFDFLVINNLDILKECARLVEENHGKKYNIYRMEDGNQAAYELMHKGLLAGVFQMETSGSAKKLIQQIKPTSWGELSDISALNRPGPMEAGLDSAYIVNKERGAPPDDMPAALAEILKDTYWTLVYQEQIMKLVSDLAGFSLQEADDVRRAMGKKKMEVLAKYREPFIDGSVAKGIDKQYATTLWDDTLIGFANYCFNKSHSICYSALTYTCAYFKANYPVEFFTALMSIRSTVMQPAAWQQKAPEFVSEARAMGIEIQAPYLQTSGIGFTAEDSKIYFGFNAIKEVGITAARSIISARRKGKFKDIWDFLNRVNRRKITTKTFKALATAGAFDRMGYVRSELIDKTADIYKYLVDELEYNQRLVDMATREKENSKKQQRKDEIEARLKEAKALKKSFKKQKVELPEEVQYILDRPARLRDIRARVKANAGRELDDFLSVQEQKEYEESLWLRQLPALKAKEQPVKPELTRTKAVKINIVELMTQADYIGCYLQQHPARVLYPDTTPLGEADQDDYLSVAVQIASLKEITTRRGKQMAFLSIGDGTGMAEAVMFSSMWEPLVAAGRKPAVGDILKLQCRVEEVKESNIKVIVDRVLESYRRS